MSGGAEIKREGGISGGAENKWRDGGKKSGRPKISGPGRYLRGREKSGGVARGFILDY